MKIIKKISLITSILICILIGKSLAKTGTVSASAVRIRKDMSTDSEIITNVYEDDKVEILEENGEWYKVKYESNVGFAKKEFIKVNSEKTETNVNSKLENETSENTSKEDTNTISNITSNNQNSTPNQNIENNTVNTDSQTGTVDTSKVIANTTIGLKLIPNLMSTTVVQYEQGKELSKITEINNWIKVTDGTLSGWITKAKVTVGNNNVEKVLEKTEENIQKEPEKKENPINEIPKETNKKGTVNVETANVRETASTSAEIIGFLDYGDIVTITAEDGDWYKVTGSDVSGYVSKKLITIQSNQNMSSRSLIEERKTEMKTPEKVEEKENLDNSETISNLGTEVAEYAKKYLGSKYIVGGKNPDTGFDCSGFTRYVYLNFGYNLGTTSSSQSNSGSEISKENMKPGDLIIFYNESKTAVGHTAIYIGNGEFVHSANPQRGVVIDSLNSNTYYNERFISARRIAD